MKIMYVIRRQERQTGLDPVKKISCIKLCYAGFEHSDWLENFEQPIRGLQTGVV